MKKLIATGLLAATLLGFNPAPAEANFWKVLGEVIEAADETSEETERRNRHNSGGNRRRVEQEAREREAQRKEAAIARAAQEKIRARERARAAARRERERKIANSTQTYNFNKTIGGVRINSAKMKQPLDGKPTYLTTSVTFPSCPNRFYLTGYLTYKFKSNDGGGFTRTAINLIPQNTTATQNNRKSGWEGRTKTLVTKGAYSISPRGNLNVSANFSCKAKSNFRENAKDADIFNRNSGVREQLRITQTN